MPRHVEAVAFSDLDETYLAHTPTAAGVADREALEDYLVEAAGRHGLLFGWVTGSSLPSVMSKVRAHRLRMLPHFIACSLGTELLWTCCASARCGCPRTWRSSGSTTSRHWPSPWIPR